MHSLITLLSRLFTSPALVPPSLKPYTRTKKVLFIVSSPWETRAIFRANYMDAFHLIYLSGISAVEHSLGEAIRSSDRQLQSTSKHRPSGAHTCCSLKNTLSLHSPRCGVCVCVYCDTFNTDVWFRWGEFREVIGIVWQRSAELSPVCVGDLFRECCGLGESAGAVWERLIFVDRKLVLLVDETSEFQLFPNSE